MLQLVWPDKRGRYPWADGYAITDGSQPVLVSATAAAELGFRTSDRQTTQE